MFHALSMYKQKLVKLGIQYTCSLGLTSQFFKFDFALQFIIMLHWFPLQSAVNKYVSQQTLLLDYLYSLHMYAISGHDM